MLPLFPASSSCRLLCGCWHGGGGSSGTDGGGGGRAHAGVLICVGCYIGDELLGGERQEAGEREGGGGGEAGEEEVVGCYCVGDLKA